MDDLISVVDWSRWQFALTAMYHWLFVPLTIGLSLIVGVMESIYYRTGAERWKEITKFWMTLFGINFACGVATGIILEFEFGTNWSNYSWFVGDIFGAPLAIEGLFAFFLESTFVAVMFFGWKKVGRGFHLAATWLTALGVCLSALWILVANAWMQYPTGMKFDPEQMRNVMDNFAAVALSPMAVNKFFHTVFSGWTLGAVFVAGVSSWLLLKKRQEALARDSMKVASVVGLAGIVLTMWTGDGSAVEVSRSQPMKLAAMEGLYRGSAGQDLVGVGILNPSKRVGDDADPMLMSIDIPYGLSVLAKHDAKAFVPGIDDLIEGVELTADGDTVITESYADKIARGKRAHEALRCFDSAMARGDSAAMAQARTAVEADFPCFGYGYFDDPAEIVPPVALTFYAFRVMVSLGGLLVLYLLAVVYGAWRKPALLSRRWMAIAGVAMVALVWICSESGWIVAEVGRQPWVIQDLMPTRAAISAVPVSTVMTTFWMFALVFTLMLVAEVSIMTRYIARRSKEADKI
jgi:cytochrome d ubiquinol oxidase subunit I